jgi:hypothetical protein
MDINLLKPNDSNPRLINDAQFIKLKESLKSFPKMMELRPIIVDENNIIQGGNMRFKALKDLGFKEIPETWVKQAKDFTAEELREFIIKDNVSFGLWDFDILAADWDKDQLIEWGLDIPFYGIAANNMTEQDIDITENFDPIGVSGNLQRVVFIFDGKEEAESYLKALNVNYKKQNMAWQVNMSTQSI